MSIQQRLLLVSTLSPRHQQRYYWKSTSSSSLSLGVSSSLFHHGNNLKQRQQQVATTTISTSTSTQLFLFNKRNHHHHQLSNTTYNTSSCTPLLKQQQQQQQSHYLKTSDPFLSTTKLSLFGSFPHHHHSRRYHSSTTTTAAATSSSSSTSQDENEQEVIFQNNDDNNNDDDDDDDLKTTSTTTTKHSSSFTNNETQKPDDNDDKTKTTSISSLAKSISQVIQQQQQHHQLEPSSSIVHHLNDSGGNDDLLHPPPSPLLDDVHIVLSVSGGCDSMALFHACMELRNTTTSTITNYHWHVVHFHHRQRSDDADQDCILVQEQCKLHNIPCYVYDWNDFYDNNENNNTNTTTTSSSPTSSSSLSVFSFSQAKARDWRRESLLHYTKEQIRKTTSNNQNNKNIKGGGVGGMILTAHHLNDSHESLLLKLLRGVHVLNLSGMEQVTSLAVDSSDTATTNNKIWLIRPLLEWSKTDLIEYLQSRNLQWREDTSNTSPKYLRNRIRNELIPLLSELLSFSSSDDSTATSTILDKRLNHLIEQCKQLQQDIQPRVDSYMHKVIDEDGNFDCSQLSNNNTPNRNNVKQQQEPSELIVSQALYQWMCQRIQEEESKFMETTSPSSLQSSSSSPPPPSSSFLTYDTLQRVLQQLQNYPEQLEWTLELGNHWNLKRRGTVLQLGLAPTSPVGAASDGNVDIKVSWSWRLSTVKSYGNEMSSASTDETNNNNMNSVQIAIPQSHLSSTLQFYSTTVQEAANNNNKASSTNNNNALRFIPPWRNSTVKLRQFLRGQNIPLHKRDTTRILLLEQQRIGNEDKMKKNPTNDFAAAESLSLVVAVFVNDKWIVDKRFQQQKQETNGFVNIDVWMMDENVAESM